jgi:undecaprenyl-diphosphatase
MADPGVLGYGEALVYGLIQGITEFLPVSSSGHLALAHRLGLGAIPGEVELAFDVLLHAATLIAIVIAFFSEILESIRLGPRFWAILAIAVVPCGLAGLFGEAVIDAANDRYWVIGVCYLYTAGLLLLAERRSLPAAPDEPQMPLAAVTWRQAALVGLFQVPALLPGISRSGSTVAGGLLGGLQPRVAVALAFLVGLPLMAAAAAKDAIDPEAGFGRLVELVGFGPCALAFVASLGSGLGAIALLKLVVGRRRLGWFAAYCLLVGLACFVMEMR